MSTIKDKYIKCAIPVILIDFVLELLCYVK